MTTDMTINFIRNSYSHILGASSVDMAWASSQYSQGLVHMAGMSGIIDYETEAALAKEVHQVYANYVDRGVTHS